MSAASLRAVSVQQIRAPGRRRRARGRRNDLANMPRDELGHLEHADLALAVEYRPERVVSVDHGSLSLILTTVFLDVVPKLFRELGARQRSGANNGSEFIVGLHRPHEGGIRLAFGRSFCGFRHTR
jgi:hypothetical protein